MPRSTEKQRIIKAAREGKSAEEIKEAAEFDEEGKPYKKRREQRENIEPGDNARFIEHAMRLAKLPPISLDSPEEVAERCELYFDMAREDNSKPSLAALALALGYDRVSLYRIVNGLQGKNTEVCNILKRAVQVLDVLLNDYMQNGKINPVSGIFLMTNTLNYQQRAEVTVAPAQPLGDGRSEDELRRKYLESVVPRAEVPEGQNAPFEVIEVEYVDAES